MDLFFQKRVIARDIRECRDFFSRARGLMFSRIKPTLLVSSKEEIVPIHMIFVFSILDVYWLDSKLKVVDYRLAKPFDPFIKPDVESKYILELPVGLIDLNVGDKLELK